MEGCFLMISLNKLFSFTTIPFQMQKMSSGYPKYRFTVFNKWVDMFLFKSGHLGWCPVGPVLPHGEKVPL